MNFKHVILLVLIITGLYMKSNASRGGGSRGGSRGGSSGGSRGGSRGSGSKGGGSILSLFNSRSRYQSGGATRNVISHRYYSWTQRHGYSTNFRYTTTSYDNKKIGIITGLIILSDYQRSRFDVNRMSFSGISICYNEFSLYGRNTTQTPWFVCPWNNSRSSYCCGQQFEEYCCGYFDRKGHLSGLIVGIIILIVVFGISHKYFWKDIKRCRKFTPKFINKRAKSNNNKPECNSLVATGNASVPEYPPYNIQVDAYPLYPPSIPVTENIPNYSLDYMVPSYPADSILPYPESANEYRPPQLSTTYPSNNDIDFENSSRQNEKPPPSYSDVVGT